MCSVVTIMLLACIHVVCDSLSGVCVFATTIVFRSIIWLWRVLKHANINKYGKCYSSCYCPSCTGTDTLFQDLHPVVDMWIHTSSELCQSGWTNLHSAISLGLCWSPCKSACSIIPDFCPGAAKYWNSTAQAPSKSYKSNSESEHHDWPPI